MTRDSPNQTAQLHHCNGLPLLYTYLTSDRPVLQEDQGETLLCRRWLTLWLPIRTAEGPCRRISGTSYRVSWEQRLKVDTDEQIVILDPGKSGKKRRVAPTMPDSLTYNVRGLQVLKTMKEFTIPFLLKNPWKFPLYGVPLRCSVLLPEGAEGVTVCDNRDDECNASIQDTSNPLSVTNFTPKLLLGKGVQMRAEWQADIDAGRCELPRVENESTLRAPNRMSGTGRNNRPDDSHVSLC